MSKKEGSILLLPIYVDDILIAANSMTIMIQLKLDLVKVFQMKDMGEIDYCLGIEFRQDTGNNTIKMSQKKYIKEILIRFGMENCKPINTPMDGNEKLKKTNSEEINYRILPYQSFIGSLLYLAISTRPDISYAVSALS